MAGFQEFHEAIGVAGALLVKGMTGDDLEVVQRNISALLLEEELPPGPKPRQLTPDEELTKKLLFGFIEIQESIDNLHNIAIYARRFPYANAGVSKSSYLRYHVENYLQELYILKERLKSYLTITARAYRLDSRGAKLDRIKAAVDKSFREVFADPLQARGRHVHQNRYSDADLKRLRGLEIVHNEDASLDGWYNKVYRETRHRKLTWIARTNQLVDQLLDVYFGHLYDLLFTSEGMLQQPQTAAQQALRVERHEVD